MNSPTPQPPAEPTKAEETARMPRPRYPDFRGPERDTNYAIAMDKYANQLERELAAARAEEKQP